MSQAHMAQCRRPACFDVYPEGPIAVVRVVVARSVDNKHREKRIGSSAVARERHNDNTSLRVDRRGFSLIMCEYAS